MFCQLSQYIFYILFVKLIVLFSDAPCLASRMSAIAGMNPPPSLCQAKFLIPSFLVSFFFLLLFLPTSKSLLSNIFFHIFFIAIFKPISFSLPGKVCLHLILSLTHRPNFSIFVLADSETILFPLQCETLCQCLLFTPPTQ